MKVYALIGKSGTGKSYQAMNVCKDKNIESIIDDGLYIYRSNEMAGISAKREPTKIGAVKTALFSKEEHEDEVKAKIDETKPQSILLLGTSLGMVKKIEKKLSLPEIEEIIYIEDITTEGERSIAYKQRHHQGKHVIPAPSFHLKRQFSGYFMDPLRIFRGWSFGKNAFAEKSVVRPTYSYLGDFFISDKVISDIVIETARRLEGVKGAAKVLTDNVGGQLKITIVAYLYKGYSAVKVGKELQKQCFKVVGEMTAFNIEKIDIEVRGLV